MGGGGHAAPIMVGMCPHNVKNREREGGGGGSRTSVGVKMGVSGSMILRN